MDRAKKSNLYYTLLKVSVLFPPPYTAIILDKDYSKVIGVHQWRCRKIRRNSPAILSAKASASVVGAIFRMLPAVLVSFKMLSIEKEWQSMAPFKVQ